jgi:hypothetical protein
MMTYITLKLCNCTVMIREWKAASRSPRKETVKNFLSSLLTTRGTATLVLMTGCYTYISRHSINIVHNIQSASYSMCIRDVDIF